MGGMAALALQKPVEICCEMLVHNSTFRSFTHAQRFPTPGQAPTVQLESTEQTKWAERLACVHEATVILQCRWASASSLDSSA